MQPDEQLEWERRAGRPAGAAAILAALLLIVGTVLAATAAEKHPWDIYPRIDRDPSIVFVPNGLQALGYLLAAVALFYLARAAAPRYGQGSLPARVMAIVGPVATAASLVLLAFALTDLAHQVAHTPRPATDKAQNDALKHLSTKNSLMSATSYVTLAAHLALGFAIVLAAVNAMRAGLLSRLLGITGIIVGVVTVIVTGASFFLALWLVSLGLIFLDRWPGEGRGPAWSTVEAIPWPSAMDRQRMRMEQENQLEAPAEDDVVIDDDEDDEDDEDVEAREPAVTPAHPASKKRKKKRRR